MPSHERRDTIAFLDRVAGLPALAPKAYELKAALEFLEGVDEVLADKPNEDACPRAHADDIDEGDPPDPNVAIEQLIRGWYGA